MTRKLTHILIGHRARETHKSIGLTRHVRPRRLRGASVLVLVVPPAASGPPHPLPVAAATALPVLALLISASLAV